MAAAAARIGLPPAEDDPLEGDESEEEVESDDGSEDASLADLCKLDAGSDEDPSFDPAADRGPEGEAALWSGMVRLSISARKGRKGSVAPKMGKEDNDLLAMVDKLMRDGQLEKLKVYECKAYLRMHKLRLSGKKEELLNRIREHIEVKNLGEVKYPVSSFVLNCKGDACKGDVVMFEQNIYRRKKGDTRGVKGRLCGQRTNAGRIIKESYGTAKQQHTFTIFWSKGYKPWPPLHPLLIKGRNLYKDKTMRQPWPDEQERSRVLEEKHARGFIARKSREVRIYEKEIGKMRRFNRFDERSTPSLQHGQPGNASQQQQISSKQNPTNCLLHQQFPYHQNCNEVLPQESATRTSRPEFIDHQVPSIQHVKPEKTSQQQILSRPTPAQQIFKHPAQHNDQRPTHAQQTFKHVEKHNNHQQYNKVLPQGGTTRTFSILGQPGNAMPQEKISTQTPIAQIRNQPQPLKPEKTSQQQILSRPTPAQQIFKHPAQHNDQRPTHAQQTFKHVEKHNNHQQHNKVLPQGGTTRTFSIVGQPGNAMPQEKISTQTPIAQIRNQPQPLKHQHHNAVLLQQGAKKETYRVESIDGHNYHSTESGKAPCIQHVGAVNARQQHISSKPTLPQQIKNPLTSPKHQHQSEVLRQDGAKRTYRVNSIDRRSNTYHKAEYNESSFQHRGAQHGNTHQHGFNGPQHTHVDHQHHPLRSTNKDFCSRNQLQDYLDQGQITREQYHPQERCNQNQYGRRQTTQDQCHQPQKIHHQNHHDSWRMKHNQYHSQENYPQNFRYAQQFPPLKPCRYYQQGLWCPYEENCKFSHGS